MNDSYKLWKNIGMGRPFLNRGEICRNLLHCLIIALAIIAFIGCSPKNTNEHAVALSTAVKQLEATALAATQTHVAKNTATSVASTPELVYTPTLSFQASFANDGNVRSGPGLNFQVIMVKKSGETVPVYGRSEDNNWLMIEPSGQQWVHISVAKPNNPVEALPLAPTLTPTVGPSATPTITPIPAVSISDIYNNLKDMTKMQFNGYKNQISGRTVSETVKIGDVLEDGRVTLLGEWSPILINISEFGVIVEGMPRDIAITLHNGDHIYIEATIKSIVGDYNYFSNRENTLVLTFKAIK